MSDSERTSLTVSPVSVAPATTTESSRRQLSGLAFATNPSGLVDAFAQVFARMSQTQIEKPTTIVDSKSKSTDDALEAKKTEPSQRSNEDEDADEVTESVKPAYLQAIATPTHETEPVAEVAKSAVVPVDQERSEGANSSNAPSAAPSEKLSEATEVPPLGEPNNDNGEVSISNAQMPKERLNQNRATQDNLSSKVDTTATPDQSSFTPAVATTNASVNDTAVVNEPTTVSPLVNSKQSKNDDSDNANSRGRARYSGQRNDSATNDQSTRPSAPPPTKVEAVQSLPALANEQQSATSNTTASTVMPKTDAALPNSPAFASAAVTAFSRSDVATVATVKSASASPSVANASVSAGNAVGERTASAPRANSAKSTSTADAVTRAKLVQRVSKAFHHLGNDGGIVRLRLSPAELGSVRVEMQVSGRKVTARVVAETEVASGLLREHVGDLRARLEAQGMQVERIEIDTEDRLQDRSDNQTGRETQQQEQDSQPWRRQPAATGTRLRPSAQQVSQSVSPTLTAHSVANGGVDVRL